MARPLRIEFPCVVYHVTSRGCRREPIVLGDEDREDLLGVLGQALHRLDACALAWRLMGTRATSPWHSAHWPTRSKSPPLIAPLKSAIVAS